MKNKIALMAALLLSATPTWAQEDQGNVITYSGAGGGSGGGGGSGTLTSLTCGAGIICSPTTITTTGSVAATTTNNAQTGTSYATLATDGGKVVSLSNASAVAVSLSAATTTGFTAGFGTTYDDIGAGTTTVTPTTSTIDGLATLPFTTGQAVDLWSDGTNYHAALSLPLMSADTLLGNFSGATAYPVAGALTNCANDGAHALVYPSGGHVFACASISGSGVTWPTSGDIVVSNGTSTPAGTAPGSGVLAALAIAHDTTGGICTVGGSGCAGGSGGSTKSYIAGNWYWGYNGNVNTGAVVGNGTIRWQPFYFDKALTIGALGAGVSTAESSTSCQFALYANGASNTPTGSALASTAGVSVASVGVVSGTASYSIPSTGVYWLGVNCNGTTVALTAPAGTNTGVGATVGAPTQANLSPGGGEGYTLYYTTQTYGTWPTNPTVLQAAEPSGYYAPQFEVTSVP